MAKKSEIIGEFIVTIHDNNSVEVSRIYKSTKKVLREIWEGAGKGDVPPTWTTQDLGRHILNELCGGAREATLGEYTIEREDNNRINVIKTYKNTKEGLCEAAKELNFPLDPREQGWNTQRFGRILVNFAQTGEMPDMKQEKMGESNNDVNYINSNNQTEMTKEEQLDSLIQEVNNILDYEVQNNIKKMLFNIIPDGTIIYSIDHSYEKNVASPINCTVCDYNADCMRIVPAVKFLVKEGGLYAIECLSDYKDEIWECYWNLDQQFPENYRALRGILYSYQEGDYSDKDDITLIPECEA